jgi:hypothetical protein
MAIVNGPYIPLSNLVLMADPRNSKCYSGAGTAATNQVDNLGMTLASIGYNGGYWTNAQAGAIQTNASYSLSLSSGFTAIQWLRLDASFGRVGGTFSYTSGANAINFYMGGSQNMRWETYLTGGDLLSNQIIPLNTWFMIAGSFSGTGSAGGSGTSKIYYNGNLDNSGTLAGTASGSAAIQIGVHSGPCYGTIGPTLFYNRALSDTEVKNCFHAYRTSFGL